MVFGFGKLKSSAAIASKANLRDSMNRLRLLRTNCGKDDQEVADMGTGDAFRDKVILFGKMAKGAREMIQERNSNQAKHLGTQSDGARDSHDVNVQFRDLKRELDDMNELVNRAEKDLGRANKKKKKAEKIANYERVARERRAAHTNCSEVLESLRDLNQERNATAKDQALNAALSPDERRKKKKESMREQLSTRLRKRRGDDGEEDGAGRDGGGGMSEEMKNDPERKNELKILEQKQAKQDAALDRIQAGLMRITDTATQIGQELQVQDTIIQGTEDKMSRATKDLRGLNRALNKMMKDAKPMNVIINVMCVFLLLGMVGFFLYEFNVI
jgi:SYP7 family syntaxin